MDRNPYIPLAKVRHCVALRKESVDRNNGVCVLNCIEAESLSARRAWIEIHLVRNAQNGGRVALRKESVDRNPVVPPCQVWAVVALRKESVDRNHQPTGMSVMGLVALRKESVDRNILQ